MYFGVIDQILVSINTRFNSENYDILSKMEGFVLNECDIDEIKMYLFKNEECDFDIVRLDKNKDKNLVLDGLSKISIFCE